ncbi:MAG: SpoIIE family protein phosphatase [Bacteroidales bacterium]|nr:SpoIIE family protein phosphatase [Bacteroidales bacterium]
MQNWKKNISLLILLFLYNISIYPQKANIKFDHIYTKQGLSHNTVHCILQDSYGFIWIGTEDGLNRYDGYEFKLFRHDNLDTLSISDNFIYSIIEDKDKQLWIGTNIGGLDKFDKKNEIFIHHKHDPENKFSISNNRINSILEDKDGTIWIATNNGLNSFNKSKNQFSRYLNNATDDNSINDNQILTIYEDRKGILWIGTNRGGLNRFDKKIKSFNHYIHDPENPNSISSNTVISIAEDNKGYLWIGTNHGLNKLCQIKHEFTHYQPDTKNPNSLSNRSVSCIFPNQSGEIWLGTANGLNIFNPESENFTHFYHHASHQESLSNNVINSIIKDNSGIIWIGVAEGGINKYNTKQKQFLHFKHDPNNTNSLDYNVVRYLYEDNNKIIWIGTLHGLNRFDINKNQYIHYDFQDGITTIIIDRRNELWLGTWQRGLFRIPSIDPNKFTSEFNWNKMKQYQHNSNNPNNISSNTVQDIYEDSFGNFWIGTEAGLNKFNRNNEQFILIHHDPANENSMSDNRIQTNCIVEDKQHNLWVGTWNGLNKLSLNEVMDSENNSYQFTRFMHDPDNNNSLSDNRIISILLNNDELWIGTYGGGLNRMIIKYDSVGNESYYFKYYTEKDGLSNNSIYGILKDDKENLWLSTNKGLSRFNKINEKFRNYFESDGLQGDQFFWGASLKRSTGEMLFGGINGFNMFYPDSIHDNLFKPPVLITDFQIFNQTVKIGKEYKGRIILKKPIYETNKIILTYKHKVISFKFASLDYSNPNNNKYAYKMNGFEENWNFVDKRRFVSYTNLPPGNYIFEIKATNSDGIWNESITSLIITINPPFWRTAWFIILEILTALIGIIVYIRFREKKLIKDKRILNEKVIERTKEIEQQKEEIQVQAEHLSKINEELEKLSIVASKTDNAVIIMDAEGNFEWVNEGFIRLYELTINELINDFGENIIKATANPNAQELIKYAIQNKKTINYESYFVTKSQKMIWNQTTLTPILDENENIKKLIAIDTDISKLKNAEEEISSQKEEIIDSIIYAKRIQNALFPSKEIMLNIIPEYFILDLPQGIVSGDFYWVSKLKDKIIIAVADCTGHGVPGAFMSMLGVTFLNKIVNEKNITKPNEILDRLRNNVITSLHQTGEIGEANDGMDIALITIDKKNNSLEYAGANNSAYLFRNNELTEIFADKMPIGIYSEIETPFSCQKMSIQTGDIIYLFTDGYTDQFGGSKGKKFLYKNFRILLKEIHNLPMNEQETRLFKTHRKWKENNEQVDDILIMGIKI